jgi:heme-degrading monooxygenase HmoA
MRVDSAVPARQRGWWVTAQGAVAAQEAVVSGAVVLHMRFNLITADPVKLVDSVKSIESEVRPQVEGQSGSLGTALYTNPEPGLVILESFWASGDAMQASEHQVASGRREAVQRAAGTVSVERFEVPVFELEAPVRSGAGLRLTRMDFEPGSVEDAVEAYGDTAVPWLAGTEGFCSTLLLVDETTGHAISETLWRDREVMAATRSVAAAVRVETVASTGCVVRAVEEYGLVATSARKA